MSRVAIMDDIKKWLLPCRGVSCIPVKSADAWGGWIYTACGSLMTFPGDTDVRPKRVCRKCQEAIRAGQCRTIGPD